MTKARVYNSETIDDLMSDVHPDDLVRTEKRMLLAARIDDSIKARGWNQNDFARALGKKPSEISKWLSGTHNFTINTLFEIERVLNIYLINVDTKPESYKIYYISINASAERTGHFFQSAQGTKEKTISVFEGKSFVSEKTQEYVRN